MVKLYRVLVRWTPAFVVMLAIFLFSNTPSSNLPDYGVWDVLVKKAAHMAGYGLLFYAFYRGMGTKEKWSVIKIFLFILLYAASDEFHQSFVAGRHASIVDVFVDFSGSFLAFVGLLRYGFLERAVLYGLHPKL